MFAPFRALQLNPIRSFAGPAPAVDDTYPDHSDTEDRWVVLGMRAGRARTGRDALRARRQGDDSPRSHHRGVLQELRGRVRGRLTPAGIRTNTVGNRSSVPG